MTLTQNRLGPAASAIAGVIMTGVGAFLGLAVIFLLGSGLLDPLGFGSNLAKSIASVAIGLGLFGLGLFGPQFIPTYERWDGFIGIALGYAVPFYLMVSILIEQHYHLPSHTAAKGVLVLAAPFIAALRFRFQRWPWVLGVLYMAGFVAGLCYAAFIGVL